MQSPLGFEVYPKSLGSLEVWKRRREEERKELHSNF
jgi:hypothetical protein